ncbi:MAG: alpha/beta hydrolase [Acidobacteriota bacterium]
MRLIRGCAVLLVLGVVGAACTRADDTDSSKGPVKAVADHKMAVVTAKGRGDLPLYVSVDGKAVDLSKPQPDVVRALLIFHGKLRNADVYNESGLRAIAHAGAAGKGTLLMTPQFLAQVDVDQYRLAPATLRWSPEGWMGGEDALNAAVSSFDAIDAMLARLGDRKMFPNLKVVVLAGHSGGAQVVQRYAVVGRGGDALVKLGVHVRYVIANPSSYVYFSPERPVLNAVGEFRFAVPAKSCYAKYDKWKYGVNEPPPYVAGEDFGRLEQRYVHRDVRYLLGTEDVDPQHPALDKTCSGEVEGPYRFYRGKAFFTYMEGRHPELKDAGASQQLWFVPGVEHDGDKMLNSACGMAALFDGGVCGTRVVAAKP